MPLPSPFSSLRSRLTRRDRRASDRRPSGRDAVVAEALEPRTLLTGVTLTGEEQYLLELINRARMDPTAESTRVGVALNDANTANDPITTEAKQPLAISRALNDATRAHIDDWYDPGGFHDFLSHEFSFGDGLTLSQRISAGGYAGSTSPLAHDEFAPLDSSSPLDPERSQKTIQSQIDESYQERWYYASQRRELFRAEAIEIGVGVQFSGRNDFHHYYHDLFVGLATAIGTPSDARTYLTGVAFTDADSGEFADDFYSIGEGLSGGTVVARDVATGKEFAGFVGPSGGYAVAVDPNATYQVRLVTGTEVFTLADSVTVEAINKKVDFDLSELTPDVRTGGFESLIGFDADTGSWWLSKSDGTRLSNLGLGGWDTGSGFTDIVRGDFDGDGRLDMAARTGDGDLVVSLLSDDVVAGSARLQSDVWGTWSDIYTWSDIQVGDFNGDGRDDLIGRAEENGNWYIAYSDGQRFETDRVGRISTRFEWTDAVVGDFDGKGSDDIAVRNAANGEWWVGFSSPTRTAGGIDRVELQNTYLGSWSPKVEWDDVQTGDFNGDGRVDILGRVASSNELWVAETNAGARFDIRYYGRLSTQAQWTDLTVANFSGDGADDIVVRNAGNGRLVVGTATGGRFLFDRFGQWDRTVTWQDVQATDIDGNGYADLVGRTARTGSWWAALSDGDRSTNRGIGQWSRSQEWGYAGGTRLDRPQTSRATAFWQDDADALDAFVETLAAA